MSSPASPSMKLFPEEISLAPMATALLGNVSKANDIILATYRLEPDDANVFRARLSAHADSLVSRRYEPFPGVWSTIRRNGDDWMLDIGVRERYGRAWVNAIRQNERMADVMMPPYQIKAQIFGFLADNGV